MKQTLIQIFWPILRFFETGKETKHYKPSHRIILIIVGALFMILSAASATSAYVSGGIGGLIPVIVFLSVGVVAVVVGTLGTDSAVSKIWGRE